MKFSHLLHKTFLYTRHPFNTQQRAPGSLTPSLIVAFYSTGDMKVVFSPDQCACQTVPLMLREPLSLHLSVTQCSES